MTTRHRYPRLTDAEGPKQIPKAVFIEDVEDYIGPANPLEVHRNLNELLQKYRFMEEEFGKKQRALQEKLPEIKEAITVIKFLKDRRGHDEPLETHYQLADCIYAEASVPPTETVCLWLGANVMLEYPLDDALALLEQNLNTAAASLKDLGDDLDFLRDQRTTTEVNVARVHNHMVHIKAKVLAQAQTQAQSTRAEATDGANN
ncbi:unnamed protein product [Vitrella brassicaformis CCMP3155]|uniref:Prefoldin subunit 3 n=2 Tax=Vitrella brassicaformis TaxID=1169539 RepID=A0A0G4H4C7_VITBC|nr:unnamed protein product [Vitrella brassicaformis CCMP3155]|mmetsp:Transcript_45886/g.114101  ORF Transcript_45886/g.114101 Transcript_45886/m.114101 type:complete len:203 (+) Transcript_45886:3439-4047(+)|eukprot:CEM38483.1 unnamed protein product [Vitrella brassicaformis CCMP3155]